MAKRGGGLNGGSRLRKKLRRMPAEITAGIGPVIEDGLREIAAEIKATAPRDTGALADATHWQLSRDKLGGVVGYSANRSGFKTLWKRGGFEALFVEFGTKTQPARPFIRPAFRAKLGAILDRIDHAVNAALRKASSYGTGAGNNE